MPIDRRQLPQSTEVLQQMVLDLIAQPDAEQARRIKTENLLRQLLAPEADAAANRSPMNNWRFSKPNSKLRA